MLASPWPRGRAAAEGGSASRPCGEPALPRGWGTRGGGTWGHLGNTRGRPSSPDDAEVIEITTATLSAKGLLEGEHHAGDVVAVPDGPKDAVAEPGGGGG